MKRIIQLFSLAVIFPVAVQSQIIIQADQIRMAGNVAYNSRDTDPDSTILVGGTGMQTWDFSGLQDDEQDVLRFSEAAILPYANEFPEANIGVQVNDGDSVVYLFVEQNNDHLATHGSYGNFEYPPFNFNTTFKYTPPLTSIRFPMQYNDAFNETVIGKIQLPGSAIGISNDSVRAITTNRRFVNVNAYGTMIAPTGTYDVLRSTEVEVTTDTIYISAGNNVWFPYLGSEPDTITLYSFWTNQNGLGFPVVQMTVKNDGTIKEVGWLKSFVSSTKDNSALLRLNVSPNPAPHHLNIELPDGYQGMLEIYDLNGKQLQKVAVTSPQEQLNVHHLAMGSYVIVLKDEQGRLVGFERFEIIR